MVKDLPKFRGDDTSEVLVNFFKDLGWDERKEVDPTKVKMAKEDINLLVQHMMNFGTDVSEKAAIGMLFVNKGPSSSESVPKGKVLLEEGWIV
jgi:hypothetical protein